ncbi:MAG TPA: hypothetical protein DCS07_16055 [Bdellovibrionales bacterium]|nr:MAG: hypothetical protein A2Z97_00635 [Bdellovibrionales bacterium GWB1_52_6]OFZ05230.1 MAG: hypothetical protein A2X97_10590 [Bdellovibrionales bacterium GWA1_52_35]HAR44120.1 hypothetical protein [Bdellovibrionales bacterium]HCM38637.1 hypothetical protein [Bdellovibrionales bacterium]
MQARTGTDFSVIAKFFYKVGINVNGIKMVSIPDQTIALITPEGDLFGQPNAFLNRLKSATPQSDVSAFRR